MKILTRRQQDEILKVLAANHIIAHEAEMATGNYEQYIYNTIEIAALIDGIGGCHKVLDTVEGWVKRKGVE